MFKERDLGRAGAVAGFVRGAEQNNVLVGKE